MPANTLRPWSKHAYDKSKMADGRHFETVETSPHLSNGLSDRHEIWHGDPSKSSNRSPYPQLKFRPSETEDSKTANNARLCDWVNSVTVELHVRKTLRFYVALKTSLKQY